MKCGEEKSIEQEQKKIKEWYRIWKIFKTKMKTMEIKGLILEF